MDYQCPICGKDMKFIPAGTSKKTGKPYNAFYACSDYGCKGSRTGDGQEKKPYITKPYSPAEAKEVHIKQAMDHKDDSMRFMAARRDATLITVAEMKDGAWSEELIKKHLESWLEYFEKFYQDVPF